MNKFLPFTCILLLSSLLSTYSQSFIVDDSQTAQTLIENVLFNNSPCEEIANSISGINGSTSTPTALTSFGSFNRGSSDFPLQTGIVIATGSAAAAQSNPAPNLGEGNATTWGGSPDLEATLGITGTVNATELSFDFTPLNLNTQFRYVFSSDEYGDVNPNACTNNDVFAILIREKSIGGAYTNIATIASGDPVGVNTLHPVVNNSVGAELCPPVNDTFFDGFRSLTTNQFPEYNGRTNVLTTDATAFVAGTTYEVKFIIADDGDRQRDSAAFIEVFENNLDLTIQAEDSLNSNLGNTNINSCSSNITLEPLESFPTATIYRWSRDGMLLPTETNRQLVISSTDTANYSLEVILGTTANGTCTISDDIPIIFNTSIVLAPIETQLCIPTGNSTILDLNTLNSRVTGTKTAVGVISYHSSAGEAISGNNPLSTNYNATDGDIVFGRFSENGGCLNTIQITININNGIALPAPPPGFVFEVCDFDTDGFEGLNTDNLTMQAFPSLPAGGTLVYYRDAARTVVFNNGEGTVSTTLTAVFTTTATGCDSEQTVDIVINTPQGNIPTLNSIEVCDDTDGNPRDGIATFDLTTNFNAVLAANSAPGFTVTFHSSIGSSQRNDNIITPSANFRNEPAFTISDVQNIGVRVEDANGCPVFSFFELRPRYLITNSTILDVNQCDNIGDPNDGIAQFDFTNVNDSGNNIEDAFLGVNAGIYTATFHLNDVDALSGANPINTNVPFINTTPTQQQLFIRISDNSTGCFDFEPFNLNVRMPVTVTPITSTVEICDADDDGVSNGLVSFFNSNVRALINVDSNLDFTYHTSLIEAQDDINPIDDSFVNPIVDANNTIFVRVSNSTTSCFETTSFQYFINRAPAVSATIPIGICYLSGTTPTTDISVNLNSAVPPAIQPNVTITFYRSQAEASAITPDPTDEITAPNIANFDVLSETDNSIWYRVVNNTTGCISVVEQELNSTIQPSASDAVRVECEDAPTDGIFDFDLNAIDNEVLNGQTGVDVLYFPDILNANARTNSIDKSMPYTNTTNPQTIAYRIESSTNQSCAATADLELRVGEFTTFNSPSIQQCDGDLTPGSTFSLTDVTAQINAGATDTFTVTYHSTIADAEFNRNPLGDTSDPTQFTTDREIFDVVARVVNSFGCRRFPIFQFQTFPLPQVTVESFDLCDNNRSGSETFDLTTGLAVTNPRVQFIDTRLIANTSINFFETDSRDINGRFNNLIPNPTTYSSSVPEKTIYVELVTNQGCFFQAPVSLRVNPLPDFTVPTTPILVCEDDFGSNQFDIDLDNFVTDNTFNLISTPATDFTFTYFLQNGTTAPASGNEIVDGELNDSGNVAIFVVLTNNISGCSTFQSVTLRSTPLPEIITPTIPVLCDSDSNPTDGITTKNLANEFDSEILNGRNPSDFTIRYFYSDNLTAELVGDLTFTNGEMIVAEIIDISDLTAPNCSNSTMPFTLSIEPVPTATPPPVSKLILCDEDATQDNRTAFDFSTVLDTDILNGQLPANFTVSYHNSMVNAENNTPLANLMEATTQKYFARVTNNTNNCFAITEFDITVNLLPVITPPSAPILLCEDLPRGSNTFTIDLDDIYNSTDPSISYSFFFQNSTTAPTSGNEIVNGELNNQVPTDIFVQIERTFMERGVTTVCTNFVPASLQIQTLPELSVPSNPNTCDDDGIEDGFKQFNLATFNTELLNGRNPSEFSIRYFDATDTELSATAILQNGVTYTVQITNNTTALRCSNEVDFVMNINSLPSIGNVGTLNRCDEDINQDGIITFDFATELNTTLLDGQPLGVPSSNTGFSVSYHNTLADARSEPPVPLSNLTEVTTRTYAARVTNNVTGCFTTTTFSIRINLLPVLNVPTDPVQLCENTFGSNQFDIDLDDIFQTDNPDLSYTFFRQNGANLGAQIVNGELNNQTAIDIYVQLTNNSSTPACSIYRPVSLISKTLPEIVRPTDTSACDEDDNQTDGSTIINFFDRFNEEILNGRDPSNFLVRYYNSSNTQLTTASVINNGELYTAEIIDTRTSPSCSNRVSFPFIINTIPVINDPDPGLFRVCDEDLIQDGIVDYNFRTILDAGFIGGQTGSLRVTYHNSMENAENNIEIPDANLTRTDTNNYFARVLNTVTNCSSAPKQFTIEVNTLPVIISPTNTPEFCAGEEFGDRRSSLTGILVSSNRDNLSITYHAGTPSSSNEIVDTDLTPTSLFIRVLNTLTGCENALQINLNRISPPTINPIPPEATSGCDSDEDETDGLFAFDFSALTPFILGSQSPRDFTVSYHRSLDDADRGFSIIAGTPISSDLYYVKVMNNNVGCSSTQQFRITINSTPENNLQNIIFCSNDPDRRIFASNLESSFDYEWSFTDDTGTPTRPNETGESISLNPSDINTNVTLVVTDRNTTCSKAATAKVLESNVAEVQAVVPKPFDDTITVTVTSDGEYLFGLDSNNINDAQESNIFENVIPGKHIVYVFDLNGCEPFSQEVVLVNYFPYFTPNGNGPIETETWKVQAVDELPEMIVYIYTRYGKLLKTLTSNSAGWDGTYNGQPMPSDDYWILIKYRDGEIKDHITLKR